MDIKKLQLFCKLEDELIELKSNTSSYLLFTNSYHRKTVNGEPQEEQFLGDPIKSYLKIKKALQKNLNISIAIEKDRGELW